MEEDTRADREGEREGNREATTIRRIEGYGEPVGTGGVGSGVDGRTISAGFAEFSEFACRWNLAYDSGANL